jgi:hypothetical protein
VGLDETWIGISWRDEIEMLHAAGGEGYNGDISEDDPQLRRPVQRGEALDRQRDPDDTFIVNARQRGKTLRIQDQNSRFANGKVLAVSSCYVTSEFGKVWGLP